MFQVNLVKFPQAVNEISHSLDGPTHTCKNEWTIKNILPPTPKVGTGIKRKPFQVNQHGSGTLGSNPRLANNLPELSVHKFADEFLVQTRRFVGVLYNL